jgi:hypothetical protein
MQYVSGKRLNSVTPLIQALKERDKRGLAPNDVEGLLFQLGNHTIGFKPDGYPEDEAFDRIATLTSWADWADIEKVILAVRPEAAMGTLEVLYEGRNIDLASQAAEKSLFRLLGERQFIERVRDIRVISALAEHFAKAKNVPPPEQYGRKQLQCFARALYTGISDKYCSGDAGDEGVLKNAFTWLQKYQRESMGLQIYDNVVAILCHLGEAEVILENLDYRGCRTLELYARGYYHVGEKYFDTLDGFLVAFPFCSGHFQSVARFRAAWAYMTLSLRQKLEAGE